MNSDLLQGFFLRDWFVDPPRGTLTRGGQVEHLPPTAMEVLLCLASSAGELVSREALLEQVWGKSQGSPESLTHAVGDIRRALGDDSHVPVFIQTLPRRGYRLIVNPVPGAEYSDSVVLGGGAALPINDIGLLENLNRRGVFEAALAYLVLGWLLIQVADIVFDQLLFPASAGTFVTVFVIAGFPIAIALSWYLEFRNGRAIPEDQIPTNTLRRRFSRTYTSVVGALAIAAVLVFVYDRNVGLPEAAIVEQSPAIPEDILPPIAENSIGVLRFMNVDGSDETQIFSNGLADELITRLSRVPGLLVSARGDSFTLDPNSPSSSVRERLRVAYYLEGSVEISNSRLRVMVQMINAASGFHVVSRRFDRSREDYFDIRNEITELTVANVRVALPADVQAPIGPSSDHPSLDAYVLYRRGVETADAPIDLDSIESSLSWFGKVLEIDPDFAAAHAGKCEVFVNAYPETDDAAYIEEAQSSCARALELNPNLDVVHVALGRLYEATGRYEDSESSFLEALRIYPNSVEALTGIADTYVALNRMEDAEAYFRRAIGLHPGDWSAYNMLGRFLYQSGQYSEAARQYRTVVALDPGNSRGYSNLGTAYLFAGEFEAAVEALERAIDIQPRANTYSSLGLLHYYLGNKDKAIEAHESAVAMAPNDSLNWANLGDALWYADKKAASKDAFERAESLVHNAMSVNPSEPINLMDLAWISAMLDRPEEALELIRRAGKLAPEDPYVHYIEGLILTRQGNDEAAIAALRLAAERGFPRKVMAAEPHLATLWNFSGFSEVVAAER